MARKFLRQVIGDFGLLQALKWDLITKPMHQQILLETLQVTLRKNDVYWPVCSNEHQLSRLATARQGGNQVESRGVDPMEIFKDQNQRILCRHRFQGFTNLPHHPLTCSS